MTEIILAIFFITVLLLFLSSGVWVALSMIGVSAIAMELFTSRPVGDAMGYNNLGNVIFLDTYRATIICLDGWNII